MAGEAGSVSKPTAKSRQMESAEGAHSRCDSGKTSDRKSLLSCSVDMGLEGMNPKRLGTVSYRTRKSHVGLVK